MGEHVTGWIFVEGNVLWPCIFNNILYNLGTSYPSNGMITSSGNIYNNTIVMFKPGTGIKCGTNSRIKDNILYNCKYPIAVANPGESTEIDYNLIYPLEGIKNALVGAGGTFSFQSFERWKELGFDLNSQTSDPEFVNIDEYDFHLEKESPARDSGFILPDIFAIDKDRVVRPYGEGWDIGAYEYKDSSPQIAIQPNSHIIEVGKDVTFSVDATGVEVKYQWQSKGLNGFENLRDKTESKFIINNVKIDDERYYRAIVSNNAGSVSSDEVFLNVVGEVPVVENLSCVADMNNVYLSWKNPDENDNDWDKVLVVRKADENPTGPDDGEEIYNGKDNTLVDNNLEFGEYHYAVYTYKETDSGIVYSDAVSVKIIISNLANKKLLRIDSEEGRIKIGQNTRGDMYSLWNEDKVTVGRGPTGNETSLWLYSDIIGNGEDQIPAGSKIVSARLILNVEDFSFTDPVNGVYMGDKGNRTNYLLNAIYEDSRNIEIYQITDPSELGMPYYAEESGIRTGLDFEYRDHRPGVNTPWVDDNNDNQVVNEPWEGASNDKAVPNISNESSILISENTGRLFEEEDPVGILGFSKEVISDEALDVIEFDITRVVQAWSEGGEDNGDNRGNQGLFITTGYGWNNGENFVLSGVNAEDEDKRPYIEIIYGVPGVNVDLTPPAEVSSVQVTSDTDSITLSWNNPTDTASSDFAGVKIIRREGIIPFSNQDDAFVTIIERGDNQNNTYTDSGLEKGKDYYYALYSYDKEHNYSDSVWLKATPGSPETPVISLSTFAKGRAVLSWDKVEGAESYRLYRIDKDQIIVKDIEQKSNPTYTDYLLKGDYRYYLTAVNETGESSFSNEISVVVNNSNAADNFPLKPGNLSVDINGLSAGISWSDNSSDESMFILEGKIINDIDEPAEEQNEWEEIARTGFDIETYLDKDLQPSTQYYYRVKAVNSKGSSEYISSDVAATPDELAAVNYISWEVISSSYIKIEWKEVNTGIEYKVELCEINNQDTPTVIQYTNTNTNYCYFSGLETGKEYIVRVTSIRDNDRELADSDIIRTSADIKGGLF